MSKMQQAGALLALALLCLLSSARGASERIYSYNEFVLNHDKTTGELHLLSDNPSKSLSVELGAGLGEKMKNVMIRKNKDESKTSLTFGADLRLDIEHPFPECTRLTWNASVFPEFRDCILYGNSANWFGGPEQWEQVWPVEKLSVKNMPMVTSYGDHRGIVDRYWINSESTYFYVNPLISLFIDSNTVENPERLCLISRDSAPYVETDDLFLSYTVCSFPDLPTAQQHAIQYMFGAPSDVPDELMFRKPIWSTWARYKRNINQSLVLEFAQEILDNGFENSQIEIDDDWETCYGELQFNPTKFPDPKAMVDQLKQMGFRVTLWVHTFVNSNCPRYEDYLQKGFFVKNLDGRVSTRWWNGNDAGAVDFVNVEASESFFSRLVELKQAVGLDGFKFDAGESGYLPQVPDFDVVHQALYSTFYNDYIASYLPMLGNATEVRTGFGSQRSPLFVRMHDKDSVWDYNNGLKTLVTTLLQMNVVGYPMVLPDMIGGNGYAGDEVSSELFLRWLQASVFMPSLQFSYVPWQFNNSTVVEISKKFVDLHYQFSDLILTEAAKAVVGGLPINLPVCFHVGGVSGPDPQACALDDEFMMGDRYLIAPVLEPGKVSRNVYLPAGFWTDQNTGLLIEGPILLEDYPAPLDVLPYFYKENIVSSSGRLGVSFALLATALFSILI